MLIKCVIIDQWYRKQQINPEECSDLDGRFTDRDKADAETGCCGLRKGRDRMFEADQGKYLYRCFLSCMHR